jgi:hypothetical protein
MLIFINIHVIVFGKSSPVTGLEWPRGFQEVKLPRFHDNGTGWWYRALLPPENTPGTHFC